MLRCHNVFDQLRNLVTMDHSSASDDDARGETVVEKPAVQAPAVCSEKIADKSSVGENTPLKSDILKIWDLSQTQSRRFIFGPLNSSRTEDAKSTCEKAHANTNTHAPTATAAEPGTSHSGAVFTKITPHATFVVKPSATSDSSARKGTWTRVNHSETVVAATGGSSAPHPSPPLRRVAPRRHVVPEKGSLYDIIVANPRLRLFLRPMGWVEDHNRLLGVIWAPQPTITTAPLSASSMSEYLDARDPVHATMNRMFLPSTRNEAPICDVLPRIFPRSNILSLRADPFAELMLWFDSRLYRYAMRVECLWRWPYPKESDADQSFATASTLDAFSGDDEEETEEKTPSRCGKPMLAYVGREWLRGFRTRHMRVPLGPTGARNEPVARLCAMQEKQLIPDDPERDPRFVGILLAMAQEHIYPAQRLPPRFVGTVPPKIDVSPDFRDVTVRLLVHDLEDHFLVYKATFSANYLRRFHDPMKAFPVENKDGKLPGLKVEVTKVAESPRRGLKERLGVALGEEIVGSIFREHPTWKLEDREEHDEGRMTPDTERWTPAPEIEAETEKGADSVETDDSVDSDNGTPKPEDSSPASRAVAEESTPAEEESVEKNREGEPAPAHGKRQRDPDVPCVNGMYDGGSPCKNGKKRRLSTGSGTAVPVPT